MTRDELSRIASGVGFDAVGVATVKRAPHADAFHEWLAAGMNASMDWIEKLTETRCDPGLSLPGARSLIALAMNYFQPDPDGISDEMGMIARYARGRDYHLLIRKRLRLIDRELSAAGGTQRCFVDSGPLLERDFAVLAGIAWHGKSTMALHPRLGTWFFLSAVVTTLEFPPDPPLPDRCGSCTRCIAACPTTAIVEPCRLDARRCISYWTIEHRGDLPEWIRPLVGSRVFGCDDCLDACPWNRFAQASREAGFLARPASHLPLRDYLRLDEHAFDKLFEGSPIRRAKRQGFLRNVCTALGNVGAAGDVPALEGAANDPDEVVARHARWALSQLENTWKSQRCFP